MQDENKRKYAIFLSVIAGAFLAFWFFLKFGDRILNGSQVIKEVETVNGIEKMSELRRTDYEKQKKENEDGDDGGYLSAKVETGEHIFSVEIPVTDEYRILGLGGRKRINQDEGMLFVFSKKDKHIFNMNNMNFNLDFIFISDNEIVDMEENISYNHKDGIFGREIYDKVLEVDAGTIAQRGIVIGQEIEIRYR